MRPTIEAEPVGVDNEQASHDAPRGNESAEWSSGQLVGNYAIIKHLGTGGMGVVFESQHLATGERVALKTAKSRSRRNVAALRAEMHTLRRIRHPGVIRILDQGLNDGLPWYAMELLGDGSLKHYQAALWARGMERDASHDTLTASRVATLTRTAASSFVASSLRPKAANGFLTETITIYRELSSALGHIHGLGLVHRDLKPSNVFLRDGKRPLLADFGLAARAFGSFGRETLGGEEERLFGTPEYAAPEQKRGLVVDARADLYSLGCMLFEVVTGQLPFGALRTLASKENPDRAVPPSELVDGVPPELDALVLRLLEEDVKERALSAEYVAEILATLSSADTIPSRHSSAFLYRPSLSGRATELATLELCRSRASSGTGTLALVHGESGIGKTFLIAELVRRATLARFRVVIAECQPIDALGLGGPDVSGPPLHAFRPLLQAIADCCLDDAAECAALRLGSNLRVLVDYEPAFAEFPDFEDEPQLEPLPAEAALERLLRAVAEICCRFSERHPLLLAIDDLQWADELSLKVLAICSREYLKRHKILVVASFRTEEVVPAIRELLSWDDVVEVQLGRLDGNTVAALAGDMLAASALPLRFVDFLVTHANGNPFFAAEYLRAAATDDILVRHSGKWAFRDWTDSSEPPQLPDSIQSLLKRRFSGLDGATRSTLEAASVLGREFTLEALTHTVRAAESDTSAAVSILCERHILEIGAGALRFAHDRLRETAYEAILPERRRELHRYAAQTLEAHYTDSPELFWQHASLARHWSAARVAERASHHFAKAAAGARAAFVHDEAIMFLNGAIREAREAFGRDHPDDGWSGTLAGLQEELGDLESRAGRQQMARDSYRRSDEALRDGDAIARGRLARKIGKTHELQNAYKDALTALDLAEQQLRLGTEDARRQTPWQSEWLAIQLQRSWACYWTGQTQEMSSILDGLHELVNQVGSATQKAQFFQVVAMAHMREERFLLSADTLRWARQAYAAIQSGDPNERPSIHLTLAFALLFHGLLDEAKPELDLVLATARRAGDAAVICRALNYLLLLARRRGEVNETRRLAEETLAVAVASQMKHYIGAAQACQGWLHFRDGRLGAAFNASRDALASWRTAIPSNYPFQWLAHWTLVALLLDGDQPSDATPHLAALIDPTQQRNPPEIEEAIRRALEADDCAMPSRLVTCIALARTHGFL